MKKAELLSMDSEALKQFIEKAGAFKRYRIARMGVGLEHLVNDKYSLIREEVAKQGYGLDKLFNDPDIGVRHEAFTSLYYKGMTVEVWTKENPALCAIPENRNPQLREKATPQEPLRPLVSLQRRILESQLKRDERIREGIAKAKEKAQDFAKKHGRGNDGPSL